MIIFVRYYKKGVSLRLDCFRMIADHLSSNVDLRFESSAVS